MTQAKPFEVWTLEAYGTPKTAKPPRRQRKIGAAPTLAYALIIAAAEVKDRPRRLIVWNDLTDKAVATIDSKGV